MSSEQDEDIEQKLVETVRNVRLTLDRIDEDAASDPAEIKKFIEDETNHVAIRREVDLDETKIEEALKALESQDLPPFEPPEGTYPLELMLSGSPISILEDYHRYQPVGIHHAQGGVGSKGSYIIACKLDSEPSLPSLMVLKEATPNAPLEVFASKVMRAMGLVSPRFKVLSPDEFRDLAKRLRGAQVTVAGSCAAIHEPSASEMGGLIMEYLSGKTISDLDDGSVFDHEEVLRNIGRCMAVDMALNCLDRIPLIWSNDGNPTNLLIATDTHEVHVIDSAYNRILNEDSSKERLDRIREAVQEARSERIGEYGERVRRFFAKATQGKVQLSDIQVVKLFHAMREGCEELLALQKQVFERAARETRAEFERIGLGAKFNLDSCLDLDFCTNAVQAMTGR